MRSLVWLTAWATACGTDPAAGLRQGGGLRIHDLGASVHDTVGSIVVVRWTQSAPAVVQVEYRVTGEAWRTTPRRGAAEGHQEQLLVGLPYDADIQWRLVLDGRVLDGEPVTTARLPEGLPEPTLERLAPQEVWADGQFLLTSINADGAWESGQFFTVILDRQGRTVWARDTPFGQWTVYPQVSPSNTLLIDQQWYWSSFGALSALSNVLETHLDAEVRTVDTPHLQHPFVQLPDGTLAWGMSVWGEDEALVELAPGATEPVVIWKCDPDWPNRIPDLGPCRTNSLHYDAETDVYLVSFYTDHAVVEVARGAGDQRAGASMWWAGRAVGGYTFVPWTGQFWWQHGVSYTDAGTLLVSAHRVGIPDTHLLEYAVDHDRRTLDLVWSSSAGVAAAYGGDAERLPNGNTLHVVGSAGVIREVDVDGTDVWRLSYGDGLLLGAGQLIEDLYPLLAP